MGPTRPTSSNRNVFRAHQKSNESAEEFQATPSIRSQYPPLKYSYLPRGSILERDRLAWHHASRCSVTEKLSWPVRAVTAPVHSHTYGWRLGVPRGGSVPPAIFFPKSNQQLNLINLINKISLLRFWMNYDYDWFYKVAFLWLITIIILRIRWLLIFPAIPYFSFIHIFCEVWEEKEIVVRKKAKEFKIY